jgi:Protein of unknown function (DUF5672)
MMTLPFVGRRRPSAPTRLVAIVIPLSTRQELLPEEEVSLRQASHFLGCYDKYLVAPEGLPIARPGFRTVYFKRKFFGSAAAHNKLVIRRGFYRAFEKYRYILVYHLDSLVLSDELVHWCEAGWDYIGAPWLPCSDTPWVKEPRVGNGGFALMKVGPVLDVLQERYRQDPASYWTDLLLAHSDRVPWLFSTLERLQPVFPRSRVIDCLLAEWRVSHNPGEYGANNDFFWSHEAARLLPTFTVAPVEEGLRFAFEAAPRLCFELNHRRLPFGCHAWAKFDKEFWLPYLLPEESAA